jgi:primosomal protein N'
MYVIEVIPLARNAPQGTLSYRAKDPIAPGALVRVPLRKKTVPALVIGCTSALEAKAAVKRAPFMLRGAAPEALGALPGAVIDAAHKVAAENGTHLGIALGALVQEALPDDIPDGFEKGPGFRETRIEDIYERRLSAYRKEIKSGAALLIAPTAAEVARLAEAFKDERPVVVTGALAGKKRAAALAAACASEGLVIATPAFAWIPMRHLRALILERASAGGYVSQKRPYLDLALAARELAKARGLRFYTGDIFLPLTLREEPGVPLPFTLTSDAELFDAKTTEEEHAPFAAVPDAMKERIRGALDAGGRVGVLAARRGYAPAVVCRDCGNTLRDERGFALSLTARGEHRVLRSADGRTKRDADAVCEVCGSWNLLPLGVGVERVEEELRAAFPKAPLAVFDAETLRTKAAAQKAVEALSAPGALIVGTEAMLPYLDPRTPLSFAGIASADTLLALPFWRARERLVRMGLMLRERADDVMVATRRPEDSAFDAILNPRASAFFAEEASLRKALGYPPYGHLLTFHTEGAKLAVDRAATMIEDAMAPHPVARLADKLLPRGRMRLSMVAKVGKRAWPDAALGARLAALPPAIAVHVDPESLW